jgi:hypothetical protein
MRMMRICWLAPALLLAACGGGQKKVVEPEPPPPRPAPPPPPPPVCVLGGAEMSLVGMVEADGETVRFCVSDGAESNRCYAVDRESRKYRELDETPRGQAPALDPDPARIETTAREVKVCVGDECRTVKPKVPRSDNPIDAVTNAVGSHIAVLLGNAERGRGTIEIWDVATGKRVGGPVKYARGDYKCGEARLLGTTLYVSASVCAGPAARGWLFNLKGKRIGEVGGGDFGTYGTVPVQLGDHHWAFLDEGGSVIAIQDVASGKVERTIDVGGVWSGGDGDEAPAAGNPGESALVRGETGQLVVVTGGPVPGTIGVVDVASGELTEVIPALQCERPAAAAEDDEPEPDDE